MLEKALVNENWKNNNGKWTLVIDGKQITGWVHDLNRDTWYYCCSDDIYTGWMKDTDGRWYYFFDKSCIDYGKQMYKGEMKTGWLKDNGKWYYLLPVSHPSQGIYKGQCIMNTEIEIDNIEYSFDTSGAWIENNKIDMELVKFIESWEGFPNNGYKYYDCVGVLTQGFGLTGEEISNLPDPISKEYAEELLINTLNNKYMPPIVNDLNSKGITLTKNQIQALVSMAYNIGYAGVLGSTLYRNICNGVVDAEIITNGFTAWCKGMKNGELVTIDGLYRRRLSEAKLFLYSDYTGNN